MEGDTICKALSKRRSLFSRLVSMQFSKMNLLDRMSSFIEFIVHFSPLNMHFSSLVSSSSLFQNDLINEVCTAFFSFPSYVQEVSALQRELLKINRIFYKRLYTVKGLTQKVQQVGFHPTNLDSNMKMIIWETSEL